MCKYQLCGKKLILLPEKNVLSALKRCYLHLKLILFYTGHNSQTVKVSYIKLSKIFCVAILVDLRHFKVKSHIWGGVTGCFIRLMGLGKNPQKHDFWTKTPFWRNGWLARVFLHGSLYGLTHPFLRYRLQILHGSLYGVFQQITQNKFCN